MLIQEVETRSRRGSLQNIRITHAFSVSAFQPLVHWRYSLVPSYYKAVCIAPRIKKPELDPTETRSYRPLSNLPVVSKLLERLVSSRYSGAVVFEVCTRSAAITVGLSRTGHSRDGHWLGPPMNWVG